MNKELTPDEAQELEQFGAIRYSIDNFCDRFEVSKVDLGNMLGVTRIQINNYRNADRVIEYYPKSGEIKVLTKEKEVNRGVFV